MYMVSHKSYARLAGRGPVLLDTLTYRTSGHSPSDASSYRTPEEVKLWQDMDSIEAYGKYLVENDVASNDELETQREAIGAKMLEVVKLATDNAVSPRLWGAFIESVMFSN